VKAIAYLVLRTLAAHAIGASSRQRSAGGSNVRSTMRFLRLCLLTSLATVVCARPAAAQFSAHATSKVTGFSFFDASNLLDRDIKNLPDLPAADTHAQVFIPIVPPDPPRNGSGGSELSAVASASAKPGVLRASLNLHATGGGGNGSGIFSAGVHGTGQASAGWSDTFLLQSAAVPNGFQMIIKAPLLISGLFNGNATVSQPDPDRVLDIGSGGIVSGSVRVSSLSRDATFVGAHPVPFVDLGTINLNPFTGIGDYQFVGSHPNIEATFAITNGVPYRLALDLDIFGDVTAERDQIADFDAEFQHTLLWGGIESVRDATTGAPITDWTITSDSGFDYSKPADVPEPSTAALLAIGCVVALVVCRR
jgi:hypothetical protein